MLDLLTLIARITGRTVPPRFEPDRPGDIRSSHADISLARSLLGFEPIVSFEDGLQRTVAALGRERMASPA